MEHIDDDKLQKYYDGELSEGEATLVRRDVNASELEQARIRQLDRVGDLVRFSAQERIPDIDSDALFSKIEEGINKTPNPRLHLIDSSKKRSQWGVSAAIAIAVAAAITFLLMRQSTEEPVAEHPMDEKREVLVETHIDIHPPAGSEVVGIDFGSNTGTVFQVEGERGQPLAVVWIDEEMP